MATNFSAEQSQVLTDMEALFLAAGVAPVAAHNPDPADDNTRLPGLIFAFATGYTDTTGRRNQIRHLVEGLPAHSLIRRWSIGDTWSAGREQQLRQRGLSPYLECSKPRHQPDIQRGLHVSFRMVWETVGIPHRRALYANVHLYENGTEEIYEMAAPFRTLRLRLGSEAWEFELPLDQQQQPPQPPLPTPSNRRPPWETVTWQEQLRVDTDLPHGEDEEDEDEDEDEEGEGDGEGM